MCLQKLVNGLLFIYFLYKAIVGPLFNSQICLPSRFYPEILVEINSWYAEKYSDYLWVEKPAFFVGVMWLEVLVQWPLCIVNLYGMLTNKSWFRNTCFIHGVCTASVWVAVMSELIMSSRASSMLLSIYAVFMGVPLVAIVNGLIIAPHPVVNATTNSRKKRA